jgi:hypothetical protein
MFPFKLSTFNPLSSMAEAKEDQPFSGRQAIRRNRAFGMKRLDQFGGRRPIRQNTTRPETGSFYLRV